VNSISGEFHFIYNTDEYDSTISFYRDGLELPIIAAWDEGPEDRGTVFRAAFGIIEIMAHPETKPESWEVYSSCTNVTIDRKTVKEILLEAPV